MNAALSAAAEVFLNHVGAVIVVSVVTLGLGLAVLLYALLKGD